MAFSINKLGLVSLLASAALAVPTHNQQRHRHLRRDVVYETLVVTDVVYATEAAAAPVVTSTAAPAVTPEVKAAAVPQAPANGNVVNWAEVQDASSFEAPNPTSATSSAPAPANPTSAAASASASASPDSGSDSSSDAKRGVAFGQASLTDLFTGSKFSWAYNWASSSSGSILSSLEFVPMLWSSRGDFTGSWNDNVNAALSSGSTHILGFNEPDHTEQANMSPSDAAAAWKQYIEPLSGKAKLVSPAVTNGPAPMGLAWLSEFMGDCSDCTMEAIALHWYDSATNIEYFKSYISGAYEQFKKPIWITEFGATGSDDEVNAFLSEVLPWLDGEGYVHRYAYFMAEEGKLLTGGALSTYGKTYAG